MNKILLLINDQNYGEALNLLSERILRSPMDDEAYYIRGNVYRKMGKFGDAINDYNKAIKINPDSPASIAVEILNEILEYRNTDLINP